MSDSNLRRHGALITQLNVPSLGQGSGAEDAARLIEALAPHRLLPVTPLLANRGDLGQWGDCLKALTSAHKFTAGAEAWLQRERETIDALVLAGVDALVLKGALLAYTVYPSPQARLRTDTDILVPEDQVPMAVAVLKQLGYGTPYDVTGTVSPTQHMWVQREGRPPHVVDLHWRLSQHPAFKSVLTSAGLRQRAVSVSALSSHAMGLSAEDALIHACIHYFGHHRGEFKPLQWVLDVDLLWRGLSDDSRSRVISRAEAAQVSGLVASMLCKARDVFATPVTPDELASLNGAGAKQWRTQACADLASPVADFVFSLRSEPTLRGAVTRVWRTLFPPASFMRARSPGVSHVGLLWSYFVRIVRGLVHATRRT